MTSTTKISLVALIVLGVVLPLFSGAVVNDFRAETGLNQVEIKWTVTAESNLKGYRVLRSTDDVDYRKITFVEAKGVQGGERTYKYIDRSVFKSSDRVYYYKIQFINLDETATDYSQTVKVSPQISSSRRTWGSIKAMFR